MPNLTQINLKELNQGELQQLAFAFLRKINSSWNNFVQPGAVEGTTKTRKGRPDIWIAKGSDCITYIEVTVDKSKKKILKDLTDSIASLEKEQVPQKEYITFLNYDPEREIIRKCEDICKEHSITYSYYYNSIIAEKLDQKEFHKIRKDFLKIPPSFNIFLSPVEFDEMQNRKNLQQPIVFIGREHEINEIIQKLQNGTKIVLVEGEPGVGKTRLCIETALKICHTSLFYDYEVRILPNTAKNIQYALNTELTADKKYIIIADDANRIDDLSQLIHFILNPNMPEGSVLLLNARSYSADNIISEIRRTGLTDYSQIKIRRLKNEEIDKIISEKPYNIKNPRLREEAVILSEGNPRMASIVAYLIQSGKEINGKDKPTIYKEYFEDVFTEIANLLDKDKDKILLGHISALRSINLEDVYYIDKLCQSIGFTNRLELDTVIERLFEREIIDIVPPKTIKIFNDSISDYIVFRFFFDDRLWSYDFNSIINLFSDVKAKQLFENLAAIHSSGYKSNKLDQILLTLIAEFEAIAKKGGMEQCSRKLDLLKVVASSMPYDCHRAIKSYVDKNGIGNLYINDLESVVEIEKKAIFAGWDQLLVPGFELLRNIYLSGKEAIEHAKSVSREVLLSIIHYNEPIPIDENGFVGFMLHNLFL